MHVSCGNRVADSFEHTYSQLLARLGLPKIAEFTYIVNIKVGQQFFDYNGHFERVKNSNAIRDEFLMPLFMASGGVEKAGDIAIALESKDRVFCRTLGLASRVLMKFLNLDAINTIFIQAPCIYIAYNIC